MHYTVVAYRWGWTNAHHYLVGQSADADRACALGREECDDRGGKYGVAVFEWTDETHHSLHAYYPSLYDEERPRENRRIEMFSGIGHDVHDAVTSRVIWKPGAEALAGQVPQAVEVPQWLLDGVRARIQTSYLMATIDDDLTQRREAGLGPRTDAETEAWVIAAMASANEKAETELAAALQRQADTLAGHAQGVARRREAAAAREQEAAAAGTSADKS